MSFNPDILVPGDCVLYAGLEVVRNWTHSNVGHATCYAGLGWVRNLHFTPDAKGGQVVATADVNGVGYYILDQQNEIVRVKRPNLPFNVNLAISWFEPFVGLPYGWPDTLGDALGDLTSNDPKVMNCSHVASSFSLAGGCPLVDPTRNPHYVTPRDIDYSCGCQMIWSDDDDPQA